MGFGLNIAQPATSGIQEALSMANNQVYNIDSGGGVNLGEIIKSYTSGPPENGGFPIQQPSRIAQKTNNNLADYAFRVDNMAGTSNWLMIGGIGLAVFTGFFLIRRFT